MCDTLHCCSSKSKDSVHQSVVLSLSSTSSKCALECEISDSEYEEQRLAPTSETKGRRAPRKIVWLKTAEFDTEEEGKIECMLELFALESMVSTLYHWSTERLRGEFSCRFLFFSVPIQHFF